ncbi:MAG TPA: ThuA domain-containing protein [Pirellulales bacterium]|jgi:trehalose utilization protein|nr:ThuA domain-containing protein [Pirellulales bacterium]
MPDPIRITVWNEFVHEKTKPEVERIYPDGIHRTIADSLIRQFGDAIAVRTATLDEPEHGLSEAALAATDVLFWWGHAAHDRIADGVVDRVQRRVLGGMGLVVLHSGHASKIFRRLMGTSCMLRWRDVGELERLWIVNPAHPLVEGLLGESFALPQSEMYGEQFDIPAPDELVLVSWFAGGEVFRSGCTFRRGKGKIVYFSPGHETFPIYHDPNVQRILANAARWATPTGSAYYGEGRQIREPLTPFQN